MELNQYNMYSYNAQSGKDSILDEVDKYKQDLMRITDYNSVKEYITQNFGQFEGKKWVKYSELNKHIYMYIDDNKVEFCALKDKKQYWGRGWVLEDITKDNN